MLYKVSFPKNINIMINTIDEFKKYMFIFEYNLANFVWDPKYENYYKSWEGGYHWSEVERFMKFANMYESMYIKLNQETRTYHLVRDIEKSDIKKGLMIFDFPCIQLIKK
jgi:hypothetical protein